MTEILSKRYHGDAFRLALINQCIADMLWDIYYYESYTNLEAKTSHLSLGGKVITFICNLHMMEYIQHRIR